MRCNRTIGEFTSETTKSTRLGWGPFGLVQARTIISHPNHDFPWASFPGENTYTPARTVSGDILRVVARHARA